MCVCVCVMVDGVLFTLLSYIQNNYFMIVCIYAATIDTYIQLYLSGTIVCSKLTVSYK